MGCTNIVTGEGSFLDQDGFGHDLVENNYHEGGGQLHSLQTTNTKCSFDTSSQNHRGTLFQASHKDVVNDKIDKKLETLVFKSGWSQSHIVKCNMCSSVDEDFMSSLLSLHHVVYSYGCPNFLGARIPVLSMLNIPFWTLNLMDYNDAVVVEFLKYGWPINISVKESVLQRSNIQNHTGAKEYPDAIQSFLVSESAARAVLGPFRQNPFRHGIVLSPLNTVPKDGDRRRVILDLSFPKEHSVNYFIEKNVYLGEDFVLSLPRVDKLVEIILLKGRGALLFKRDLKRAYRQIPVDPADWGFLAYRFRAHIYFDMVLPNGLRSAVLCCQRTTSAVAYMFSRQGYHVVNYIDDFGGCDTPDRAWEAFTKLGDLLRNCGLAESVEKQEPPSTSMVFLGILVNTVTMSLEVSPSKLLEIHELLLIWLEKDSVYKRELQSLIGKLNFVASCVRSSRIFFSRMLNFLRTMEDNVSYEITLDFRRDVYWWFSFMRQFNGVSYIIQEDWSLPDSVLATDACLSGCGGVCGDQYFHAVFPEFIASQGLHINALELLAVLVGLKLWSHKLKYRRFVIQCDNMASVTVINSGKTRDLFLQACLRELCFVASVNNFEVQAVHIAGVCNRLPDLLSRIHLHEKYHHSFLRQTKSVSWCQVKCEASLFRFSHDW